MSTATQTERTPEEALAGFPVEMIEAEKIDRSPYQSRTIDLKSPKLLKLSLSIAEQGVLQPLTIRPGKVDGRWELVFGERRLRASILAGHTYVPCILRHRMTDAEAALAVVTENNQREDPTPLEQGHGVQILLDQGLEASYIADKLGYTKAWVYHLAALTKLTAGWQEAVREPVDEELGRTGGPQINSWTIQHLEEVARLPVETQDRLLKMFQGGYYHRPNLEDLRRSIGELTHQLGKAGFPLDDGQLLRGAPACVDCWKREGMTPTLFGIEEEREVKADRCLDKSCFNRKQDAWARREVKEVKAKHPEILEVKKVECGWVQGERVEFSARGQGFERAKKADKGAVRAVVTSRSGAGEVVYVKPKGTGDGRSSQAGLMVKVLRAGLNQYRQILALAILAEHLKSQTWAQLNNTVQPALDLLRLLGAVDGFGDEDHYHDRTLNPSVLVMWAKKSDDQVLEEVWIEVRESLINQLTLRDQEGLAEMMKGRPVPEEWMVRKLPYHLKAAQATCGLFKLEWVEFVNAAAQALPEPAEWKGLKAGDVPGKAKAAAKEKTAEEKLEDLGLLTKKAGKGKKAKGKAAAPAVDPGEDETRSERDEARNDFEGVEKELKELKQQLTQGATV